jgi:signal transduction histidine kinase
VWIKVDGRDRKALSLSVTNRGTVPSEIIPRLFDPFRSAREQSNRKGLGLGLYIVQQIVAAHLGRVEVVSQNGITTFSITLPRAPLLAAANQPDLAG